MVTFDIRIKTPSVASYSLEIETLYFDSDKFSSVDKKTALVSFTATNFGLKRFQVNQPVQWDTTPGAEYIGPLNMFLQPSSDNPDGFILSF